MARKDKSTEVGDEQDQVLVLPPVFVLVRDLVCVCVTHEHTPARALAQLNVC